MVGRGGLRTGPRERGAGAAGCGGKIGGSELIEQHGLAGEV